jgi:CubicO group peptidase (beta-lactamase class C family)
MAWGNLKEMPAIVSCSSIASMSPLALMVQRLDEAGRSFRQILKEGLFDPLGMSDTNTIHKIIAGRPRDIENVSTILAKNPAYDRDCIPRWLGEFDSALDASFRGAFNEVSRETSF